MKLSEIYSRIEKLINMLDKIIAGTKGLTTLDHLKNIQVVSLSHNNKVVRAGTKGLLFTEVFNSHQDTPCKEVSK